MIHVTNWGLTLCREDMTLRGQPVSKVRVSALFGFRSFRTQIADFIIYHFALMASVWTRPMSNTAPPKFPVPHARI